ncbi:hypothetical protein TanjilG_04813 [Lupinus angustifolius]|uniref:DDHD domain-containing protein n=1 Tax=Lupinus angustifolius TaxID=3871 RepID=A0A4P1QS13_LUPAN|nr:PREDICTED: phospholipase SGR2 isoform X1 [Lupinus angustifolius]OIV93581.1 hypothetical protein TanjilG_04813 [Lupinus angustifolius]
MGEIHEPNLLKNTPSNIAHLEDVIEQSKARHKYLARTTSPSDGGDVRWYFCKIPLSPNELAASVPSTEIVGKSDYFRFGMRDSLAIEASFLQREEELLSSWWKEYAECSQGPRQQQQQRRPSSTTHSLSPLYEIEEERVGVPVKGGLYEVDLIQRHCFPVYWNGENRRVLRGHWFARKGGLDWLPLREDVAEQLEIAYYSQVWHRRTFQPSGLFAARVDLQGSTPGLHALFTGEDATWEAWLNVDASGFPSFVGFTRNGIKLRRGYSPSNSPKPTQDELRQQKEEEMDDYCSQVPVRHLVFMVHGIGQRLEKSNLVDDVGNFRHITSTLAEEHLTLHQRGTQRVLFIPCQWRKGMKLSGETAVEKITLDGVRGVRVMLSATVHDVLYYMSPIYCQDIIDSVTNQLNRLYLKFLKRNPGYDGKVSLYGHSLGSVLSYDILCHQHNLSSPFPMHWMYEEHSIHEESLPDEKNHDFQYSSNNQDDTSGMVSPSNEKITQQSPSEAEAEYSDESSVLGPAISSVHSSTAEPNSVKLSNTGDVSELLSDSNDMLFEKMGVLAKPESMNIGLPVERSAEEDEGSSNKDEVIKTLREEIDSLKANLADVESRVNGHTEEGSHSVQQSSKKSRPLQDASKSFTPYIKYTKLEFKVDTFFAVGSPLGVFLSLRNIRIGIGRGQEYWEQENISEEMPACRQMFNIFHPYDPVAYRIEPLVCKEYLSKRPVLVPYHRGGKRLHIGFQEFTEDLAVRTLAIKSYLKSARAKVLTICQSSLENAEGESSEEGEETSYGSLMMERLTGSNDGRVDHMLQDKTFEHPYLQAIGAHTNYWRDYDTALFILRHLYRDIPEDPDFSVESSEANSKNESTATGWYDHRDNVEEDLPLTFSDKVMVRNFSSKAKKIVNAVSNL